MCVKGPQRPPFFQVCSPMGVDTPLQTQYARPGTDLTVENAKSQECRMGSGIMFKQVYPDVGKNTGWTLSDVRRPLPPALEKRPNCMLNTDFRDIIGPPGITGSPHGNQVWMNEQGRVLAKFNSKINSGSGALNYYNLYPDAIATGGGGGPTNTTVYGFTFRGVGNVGKIRAMPTQQNYRHETVNLRTMNNDKAAAKPGSLFGQERAQLGITTLPSNCDIYEVPWRTMLPSKNPMGGLPAGPEDVIVRGMRRGWDDAYGYTYSGPKGPGKDGERQMSRGMEQDRIYTKQSITTGYLMHGGGRPYGNWENNDALDTRLATQEFTQLASRPPNPGYIGGLEFVGDTDKNIRNLPAVPKHTKRTENMDYAYNRFKVPDKTYALQFNQQFPWFGDKRKGPEILDGPDSAILATYRKNPFAQPINPYERYRR